MYSLSWWCNSWKKSLFYFKYPIWIFILSQFFIIIFPQTNIDSFFMFLLRNEHINNVNTIRRCWPRSKCGSCQMSNFFCQYLIFQFISLTNFWYWFLPVSIYSAVIIALRLSYFLDVNCCLLQFNWVLLASTGLLLRVKSGRFCFTP